MPGNFDSLWHRVIFAANQNWLIFGCDVDALMGHGSNLAPELQEFGNMNCDVLKRHKNEVRATVYVYIYIYNMYMYIYLFIDLYIHTVTYIVICFP